jgi:hypothetical protein
MTEEEATETPADPPTRLELVRDVLVFQAKLACDGLLDFLLIPVSAAAAILSFIGRGEDRDAFYRVVDAGARADRWINLFGARDRVMNRSGRAADEGEDEEAGMDAMVGRIETYLRREYQEGRLPEPARGTIDRVIARLREDGGGQDR